MLKGFANAWQLARVEAGSAAFEVVHQEFRGHVGAFEADVAAYRRRLENAYAFLEDAFGEGNELLMFTTEATARRAMAHFVSRYGCDAFSRHSEDSQMSELHRVLRPGGLLVCEVALADAPRDEGVVEAARGIGNSI